VPVDVADATSGMADGVCVGVFDGVFDEEGFPGKLQ